MEGEKNNMNIQDLVRERVIGNIKTGKKNGKDKKLGLQRFLEILKN